MRNRRSIVDRDENHTLYSVEERHIDPFNEFMKTLKKPAAEDIVQHLKMSVAYMCGMLLLKMILF